MSNDTKWIIGTAVVLAGLLSAQIASVNTRIDDLRADFTARMDDLRADLTARMDDLRADLTARMDRLETRMNRLETRMNRIEARMDGLAERVRNVEIVLAKVGQRLLTIERVVLPAPEPPAP